MPVLPGLTHEKADAKKICVVVLGCSPFPPTSPSFPESILVASLTFSFPSRQARRRAPSPSQQVR